MKNLLTIFALLTSITAACSSSTDAPTVATTPTAAPAAEERWNVELVLASGAEDCERFRSASIRDFKEPAIITTPGCKTMMQEGKNANLYVCGSSSWAIEYQDEDIYNGTFWMNVYNKDYTTRCTYRMFLYR